MSAAKRRRDGGGVLDALDQHIDAIATPEQFAVEHHRRNAENTKCLRFLDDPIMFGARRPMNIFLEIFRRASDRGDHAGDIR